MVVNCRTFSVGGPRLLAELGAAVPTEVSAETRGWAADGRAVLHVVADGRVLGALAVEDEIRPESVEAVEALHRLGMRVAMITGDSQAVADSLGRPARVRQGAAPGFPRRQSPAGQPLPARGPPR